MIRFVTQEDKEWVLDICQKVYCDTKFGWKREDAGKSFDAVIKSQRAIFIRDDHTFFYAVMEPRLCDYTKKDAGMELLVGEGGAGLEAYNLIKMAKELCKANGIERLTISSITNHDFGELMIKNLGAMPRTVYDIYM